MCPSLVEIRLVVTSEIKRRKKERKKKEVTTASVKYL